MRSGKPTQVKVRAASVAEHDRWKAEAKRRKWSLNTLVRESVNRMLSEADARVPEAPK